MSGSLTCSGPWEPPNSDHEIPDRQGAWGKELVREREDGSRDQARFPGGERDGGSLRVGLFWGPLCLKLSLLRLPHRLSHEAKLCEQMVPMVQGPGRNPPRQAGQRVPRLISLVRRGAPGKGAEGLKGEAGGRATIGGGAEGRGARPGWPLKGRPS